MITIRCSKTSRLRWCFIIALQEFHRSQCFFALATQIATLVSVYTRRLQPTSLEQAMVELLFLVAVAHNNLYCVSFLYYYLRRTLDRNLFTHFLSWTSYLLALLTSILLANMRGTVLNALYMHYIIDGQKFQFCDGANPIRACLLVQNLNFPATQSNITSPIILPLISSILMVIGLLEDYGTALLRWIDERLFRFAAVSTWFASVKVPSARKERLWFGIEVLWILGRLTHLGLFWYNMTAICIWLASYARPATIDMKDWSFGQVVAITIWTQPVMELLQLYFSK